MTTHPKYSAPSAGVSMTITINDRGERRTIAEEKSEQTAAPSAVLHGLVNRQGEDHKVENKLYFVSSNLRTRNEDARTMPLHAAACP
jgi:hypothetical protein